MVEYPSKPRPSDDQDTTNAENQMDMHNERSRKNPKETNQDDSQKCKSLGDANMDIVEETPQ